MNKKPTQVTQGDGSNHVQILVNQVRIAALKSKMYPPHPTRKKKSEMYPSFVVVFFCFSVF